jgi:hypothetical protein
MIPIFIGYDPVETVAYHVLQHSIIEHASERVCFFPIGNTTLPEDVWWRNRGQYDSTEFSNARFMVPKLFYDWAIFMDCDMICQADIAQLWDQRDDQYAVMVRKHKQQVPLGSRKFLDQDQTAYERKNWSSLMLINGKHPAWDSVDPNKDPGLGLHTFGKFSDNLIGEIEGEWNYLAMPGDSGLRSKLAHFTLGGPWHGWTRYSAAFDWANALSDMLGGRNPQAHIQAIVDRDGVIVGGSYHPSEADLQAETKAQEGPEPGSAVA